MADWSKILSKGNVEDIRASPLAFAGGGLSLVGIGIVLIFNILTSWNIDIGSVINQLPAAPGQSSLTNEQFDAEDSYEQFSSAVLGSNNDVWREIFQESGDSIVNLD